jgi:hypothetical protein
MVMVIKGLLAGAFLSYTRERDGMFGASLDAQPASFAGVCVNQNRLLPSMSKAFDHSFDA